jgi:L-amino acid N-acyltransferase YncA
MAGSEQSPSTGDVLLREVAESDLPILFEHQLDPEANQTAACVGRKHNIASIRVLEKCGFSISGEKKSSSNAPGDAVEGFVLKLET